GSVGAVIAKMCTGMGGDGVRRDALALDFSDGGCGQAIAKGEERRQGSRIEGQNDTFRAERPNIGEPHSVGGEHAGVRVNEDRLQTERAGNAAGVLAASAAEAVESIFGYVIATLDRNLLDGVRHVLDGD